LILMFPSRVAVGKGETLEGNIKIKKDVGAAQYDELMRKAETAMATPEELEQLLEVYYETDGKRGITYDAYINLLNKWEEPGYQMEKQNRALLDRYRTRKQREYEDLPSFFKKIMKKPDIF